MDSTPRRPEVPVGPPRAATVTASSTRHPQRRLAAIFSADVAGYAG